MDDHQPKIQVVVRKRPMNKRESIKGEKDIVVVKDAHTVAVRQQKLKVDLTKYTDEYAFTFDGVYDEHINNVQLYQHAVKPLIDSAFSGAKVTCFAYGQTGSGKTYTMLGNTHHHIPGLYLLATHDIFKKLSSYQRFTVWVSFYEIYCGKLHDLLNDRAILFAREDAKQNVNIVGLQEKKVGSVEALMQTIEYGGSVRVTAQNSANADSSRSHAVLQIMIKDGSKSFGRISFIDLAGSERGADHADQSKQTRMDGAEINKSLLALKECIRALDQNKNHTPFRGSKLTMVLKDSFTGYCRSLMIATISPGSGSCENTLNTLKYADRVKELKRIKEGQRMDDILGLELMLPRQNRANQMKLVMEEDPDDFGQNFDGNLARPPPLPIPTPYRKQKKSPQRNELFPSKPSSFPQQQIRQLTQRHQQLIGKIISSQEQLLEQHQAHISETVQIVKNQGQLLAEVDKVNSDVNAYVDNLEGLLSKKAASIIALRKKIAMLKMNIRESQEIEKIFNQHRVVHYESLQMNDELLLDDLPEQYRENQARLF